MTFFRSGLLAASIIVLSSGSAFADYELNILHINDLHSRIESINKFRRSYITSQTSQRVNPRENKSVA